MRAELGATDEILASAVYSQLNADPIYYFRHVDVTVDQGVADLSGYVWSTDAIYQARKIAMNVPGVTGVRTNQLQLERNGKDTGPHRRYRTVGVLLVGILASRGAADFPTSIGAADRPAGPRCRGDQRRGVNEGYLFGTERRSHPFLPPRQREGRQRCRHARWLR